MPHRGWPQAIGFINAAFFAFPVGRQHKHAQIHFFHPIQPFFQRLGVFNRLGKPFGVVVHDIFAAKHFSDALYWRKRRVFRQKLFAQKPFPHDFFRLIVVSLIQFYAPGQRRIAPRRAWLSQFGKHTFIAHADSQRHLPALKKAIVAMRNFILFPKTIHIHFPHGAYLRFQPITAQFFSCAKSIIAKVLSTRNTCQPQWQ